MQVSNPFSPSLYGVQSEMRGEGSFYGQSSLRNGLGSKSIQR